MQRDMHRSNLPRTKHERRVHSININLGGEEMRKRNLSRRASRRWMAGALLVACLFGVSGGLQAQAGKKSAGKLPPIKLSSKPPFDVTAGSDTSLNGLQEAFDVFSWNSFIALNWPAAPDGSPNSAQKPGAAPSGDNDTVWEHWVESSSIIVPPG
jgi:hypothetical protein